MAGKRKNRTILITHGQLLFKIKKKMLWLKNKTSTYKKTKNSIVFALTMRKRILPITKIYVFFKKLKVSVFAYSSKTEDVCVNKSL